MVSLKDSTRKRESSSLNGEAKRAKKSTSSSILTSYLRLPNINEFPTAKTTPLNIYVWGTGSMCELGLGPAALTKEVKRPRLNPFLTPDKLDSASIVDFAVGGMHVLALDNQNRVWSWGNNDSKVLGRDTSKVKEQLKSVDGDDSEDEDGDLNEAEATPGLVQGLPDGKITQLLATDNLSAVLLENGDVYSWGTFRGNEGIIGYSKLVSLQGTPQKMKTLKNIVQLAGGKDHVLALDTKGIVYAWGNGQQYQLGRRILDRHQMAALEPHQFGLYDITFVACGDFHCFAIRSDKKVFAWGLNQYGQCGITNETGDLEDGSLITKPTYVPDLDDLKVKALAAGEHHSFALSEDGRLFSWGRIDMKELGIPSNDLPSYSFKDDRGRVRSIPKPTQILIGKKKHPMIKAVGTGSHHSFAITEDGVVYSWGFGDTYGPGLGPLDGDVETPTRISNTATKNIDLQLIGGGGQFSVAGGIPIDQERAEARSEKYEDIDDE